MVSVYEIRLRIRSQIDTVKINCLQKWLLLKGNTYGALTYVEPRGQKCVTFKKM